MTKKLENYFAGKDIREYYNKMSAEHPEHIKKFREEKKTYLICGKIIPDVIDVSAIVLGCYSSFFISAALIGVSEAIRHGFKESFQQKKLDYAYSFLHETLDKVTRHLEEHPDAKIELKIIENKKA